MQKNVLFLCIGNSCRSQMAEGFARRYGPDVMNVTSAGIAPAPIVQPLTQKVMEAKNIRLDDQYPKDVNAVLTPDFDLIVNMSGRKLGTRLPIAVRDWNIEDPIGREEELYVKVRDQIENLVMQLILEFRREARRAAGNAPRARTPVPRLDKRSS